MADITDSVTPLAIITPPSTTPGSRALPVREDCWSEEATSTLIDAWGRRYVELNRGNLRQMDWQDVADAVNALHGHTKKTHRTDVQCKNRIDTIKKKYKIEKTTVAASNGTLMSSWPFFERLDALIGSNFTAKKVSPLPKISPKPSPRIPGSPPVALPLLLPYRRTPAPTTVVALPKKRPAFDDGYFKRNYSAAAVADIEGDEEEGEESEGDESEGEGEEREGMKRFARAIERLGQVYERVEREKLRQMVELEKQRMQFAKDLEVQRMKMFMDTQVQLEKIKRSKRPAGSSGEAYSSS
ncbi:hypothetical protein F3Y22_tig00111769pilonHSYRG00682 [Hibiscus syriacus]|uniref:Myb/SANT-like DNA-binding domain-containing protein n=1 Tax=Hibiscus syriacus TaxID=106335 RepID=A0A6A2XEN2_HIBSY|nr:hypothetical protein F3Y22_tig00111769pilonHSYRG00682 [Hibiscus syriacus]